MATNQQAIANKNNAAKSTGPKTEDGKASVSGNALKHGLQSSTKLLLHDEDLKPWPNCAMLWATNCGLLRHCSRLYST